MTERESETILAFNPPPLAMLRLWLAPARGWHQPSFIGVERVDPSRPTMFVGNHTLYGVQDVPHILFELKRVHGIFPRTLSDRVHFEVPVWRDLLTAFGCVEGTRENCRALMRAGQHLMVFPGGQREVFKRKNEAYRLIWKERIGFVTLAAAFGYSIVPFASLGADESLHIAVDGPDIMSSPIGKLLQATGIADKYLRGGEAIAASGPRAGAELDPGAAEILRLVRSSDLDIALPTSRQRRRRDARAANQGGLVNRSAT